MPDGRFAPSPTGTLHIGNLRTALLAWLFARSAGASFLMRIEDLDEGRVRPHFEQQQLDDLMAIGIDWDGEVVRQSERQHLYADALAQLERDGVVYPCWCSRSEIREAASAAHGPLPEGAYPGTCRELTAAQRAEREASDRPSALRLNAGGATIGFTDRVLGDQVDVVDDFVLRRGDGVFSYNLAVVIDDADQGVGEIVRGADLIDSTARQLHLARLLKLAEPGYAHVPLVLGPDGARLAKRHGAVTLADRLEAGDTVPKLVGWMARTTGQAEPGEELTADALVARFDPGCIRREPTTFSSIV